MVARRRVQWLWLTADLPQVHESRGRTERQPRGKTRHGSALASAMVYGRLQSLRKSTNHAGEPSANRAKGRAMTARW